MYGTGVAPSVNRLIRNLSSAPVLVGYAEDVNAALILCLLLSGPTAPVLVAAPAAQASVKPMAPPPPNSLFFGSSPRQVGWRLGKVKSADDAGGFVWHSHDYGPTMVRVAYYRDRLSSFTVLPAKPLSWSEAQDWARAFVAGLDTARVITDNPAEWYAFKQISIVGRPFEAEFAFSREGDKVTALRGEIHWLD